MLFNTSKIKTSKIETSIKKNLLKFRDISAKALITYTDSHQSYNLLSQVIIYKDSVIYFNAKLPLGISLAKIKITKDSIFYKNFLNGDNFSSNIYFLKSKYNLMFNYTSIQSLLTADLYTYPDTVSLNNYILNSDSIVTLSYRLRQSNFPFYTVFNHVFYLNSNLIQSEKVEDYTSYTSLYVEYKDYYKINDKFFPKTLYLQIVQRDTIDIKIKIKNVKVNTNPNINF